VTGIAVKFTKTISTITLLTSFSTLFCCALPALFVTLGAGAVLAGVVSTVPQLVWLSEHKVALFIFAGLMLAVSGAMRYASRNAPCPIDPEQARACTRLRKISLGIYIASLAIYATGFFFAFIAPYLIG
jgi:hypothetical protein